MATMTINVTEVDIRRVLVVVALGLAAPSDDPWVTFMVILLPLLALAASTESYRRYAFYGTVGVMLLALNAITPSLTLAGLTLLAAVAAAKEIPWLAAGFLAVSGLVTYVSADTVAGSFSLVMSAVVFSLVSTQTSKTAEVLEEKASQADLERERLRSLINSMADAVIATDQQGNVLQYNGAALNLLDVNATLENQNLMDYLDLVDKNDEPINLIELAHKRNSYIISRDYRLKYSEHDFIHIYISLAPVHSGYGKQIQRGYIILLRDITHEKSLEEERDEFISVVSHELRTPITITEGNISNALLIAEKQGIKNKAVLDALDSAHTQSVYLAEMMNDLATLSRAERGKSHNRPETINPHELIRSLKRDYGTDARQKNLQLKVHMDKNLREFTSSRLYVREILQNFITNAIKYTQEGSVTISAKMTPKGDAEFKISDTGIGISKEDQQKLFEKFFRSEDVRTQTNSGTGLGLYVTKKLARIISAKISVKSELDKGSTFTVRIPNIDKFVS